MCLFLMVFLIMISYHLIMQALAQIALLVKMFGGFFAVLQRIVLSIEQAFGG